MTDTAQSILAILLPLLAAAVPLVRKWLQREFTPDQLAHAADIARVAVRAAEQVGEKFKGEDPADWGLVYTWGVAKAQYAEHIVEAGAKQLGLKLTDDQVSGFVQQALREMEQLAQDTK